MAIIVSIIIIVAYCIYDRQRTNDKQKVKALNERIDASNKQIEALGLQIDVLVASLPGEIQNEFSEKYNATAEPVYSGQSHDPND